MLPEKKLCIASVSSAHGIKGHLKIRTFLADPESILDYKDLYFEDGSLFSIKKILRINKGSVIAVVDGISDRNKAEEYKGKNLYIDRERLPRLEEDTFYHTDLINLAVHDKSGNVVGFIKHVHDYGAGPLLEVCDSETHKSVLVPFRSEAVPHVYLEQGYVVIAPAYLEDLS